ncbi:hypothetical protein BSZ37_04135 [Rubrivirga marina]|uniref:Uncharacterized protein n=1 Tax=Rubrivirga marina TaxID=1196024 RepID=A0A271IX43_9BACT|nr:hypothetical protein BSZ37_04135 [Rubrivirga marina]
MMRRCSSSLASRGAEDEPWGDVGVAVLQEDREERVDVGVVGRPPVCLECADESGRGDPCDPDLGRLGCDRCDVEAEGAGRVDEDRQRG